MTRRRRALALAAGFVLAALAVACGAPDRPNSDIRLWTDEFEIRAWPDPLPPRAGELVKWTVTVKEKESRAPVANGEGRIFATNEDRKSIWQAFTYGPEVGTYHAELLYVTSGDWAHGIQFRRDSTRMLQRTTDWRQTVRNAVPPGGN